MFLAYKMAATMLATLFIFDPLLRLIWFTGRAETNALEAAHETKEVIIILTGFQTSGRGLARTLEPGLRRTANTIVVEYPQAYLDLDEIYDLVFDEIERHGWRNPSFFGGSFGGLIAAYLIKRYADEGQPYGQARLLVIDSGNGSPRSTQIPERFFPALGLLRFMGPISTALKAPLVLWMLRHGTDSAEPGADLALIRRYYRESAFYPMSGIGATLRFMARTDVSRMDLSGAVGRVIYVAGPGDEDPFVKRPQAIEEWRTAFPELEVVRDLEREVGSHNPSAERPSFVARLFARNLPLVR